MNNYDVIVIGAGNGGLAAAATLAEKGKKTILFEKHNIPGGCGTSFRRGRFEFEVALHQLSHLGTEDKPGPLREQFRRYGIEKEIDWIQIEELYMALALQQGKPVVALESTIISHGMPYPQNVETALKVEKIVRENGAVPATIAVIGGRLKAGLTPEEIEYFGHKGQAITKASRRDLAMLCARNMDGATTVTTTMIIAHMAGINIFATGGIGGVHRGAETTMDISADLEELAHTPVMVVCAGAKAILDLGLTLEYLETHGVPVLGYGTEELPAFYTRSSGFSVDYRVDTPQELARAFKTQLDLELGGGMLVTNPIPEQFAMDQKTIDSAIDQAIRESVEQKIHGKAITPFLLARVAELTGGDSLDSNIHLVCNNAALAAQTAAAFCKI